MRHLTFTLLIGIIPSFCLLAQDETIIVIPKGEKEKIEISADSFFQKNGRGAFSGQMDQNVKVEAYYLKNKLILDLEWEDNVWDTQFIPLDSIRWNHPSGRSRDRMYYYDGLSIRLFQEDNYFQAWLKPHPNLSIQWENTGSIKERTRIPTSALRFKKVSWKNNTLMAQVRINLKRTYLSFDPSKTYKIQLIFTDTDSPNKSLIEKENFIKYKNSDREEFKFERSSW